MITKKIKIINCYFGKLPATFELWLYSCSRNTAFDFLIVTDQIIKLAYDNVEILKIDFDDLKKLIKTKIPLEVNLVRPYKLCDFKILYGIIFEDFLSGYDFWGYCDNDMIFGNLEKYFTDEILEKYLKILYLGHLSLYKNIEEINSLPLKENTVVDWKKVYSTDAIFGVDEDQGIYQIYLKDNIPVYNQRIFFDINPFSTFMKLDNIINKRMNKPLDINYKKQLFIWKDGMVFRYFIKKGKILKEEGLYIHCGKNQITDVDVENEFNTIIFTKHKLFAIKKNEITEDDIINYNQWSLFAKICDVISWFKYKMQLKIRSLRR